MFIVSLNSWYFFVYSVYTFRGKQSRSLTLNYCVVIISPMTFSLYIICFEESREVKTFFSIMKNLNQYFVIV